MWSDFYALSNLVQALLAGALALVLLTLYRPYRRAHLRLWAIAWTGSAISLLANAASVQLGQVHASGTAAQLLLWATVAAGEALQAAGVVAGASAWVRRVPPLRVQRLGLAGAAIAGALLGLGQPGSALGQLRAGLLPALSGVAFLWAAVLLWRGPAHGAARAAVQSVLAVYGLLKLGYPLLLFAATSAGAAAWEPRLLRALATGDSLLQAGVDVAMLVWLLLEERGRVETVSGELRRVTRTDPLTRLPNRPAFVSALAAALPRARAEQRGLAVLLLDLDGFKPINESLGQALGDELLREMARRLRAVAPARSGLARLGGDEFALLLPDPGPPAHLEELSAQLLAVVREPLHLGEHQLQMTASVGIAVLPAEGDGPEEELLGAATLANSVASAGGGDRVQLYLPALAEEARGRFSLTLALRRAIDEREFLLHFQPILSLRSGRVEAVEALLRWQQPGGSLVLPGGFLPLCVAAGIADDLDDFVLCTACAQARELRSAAPDLRVAVNLSARFFQLPGPVERVRAALRASGLAAAGLELEITETAAMRDADGTLAVLRELKALGVRLAIDDFGTGYSSLSYLRRFPVDTLKIDQSFVRALGEDPGAGALIDGILALARSLRLAVVAEGVETGEQLRLLRELGCELVQGFALGRPLPREECQRALPDIDGRREPAAAPTRPG